VSSHDDRHEALRDDLAAYALGALPATEASELERHLAECDACRERLRWLRPAVDLLPASVEQRTPPDQLRARLLATVRAEAGDSRREGAGSPQRRERRIRLPSLALRPAAGLAAAVLVALGAAAGYALRGSDDDTGRPASTFVEAMPLGSHAGEVSVTLEHHGNSATLHVDELPRLERDQVYEVWVQRAGAMEPSSLFVLDRNGTATAAVPGPLDGADAVLVTSEPRGGSLRPTTTPLIRAPL
jgi:anti-sigma-K factor RskA